MAELSYLIENSDNSAILFTDNTHCNSLHLQHI